METLQYLADKRNALESLIWALFAEPLILNAYFRVPCQRVSFPWWKEKDCRLSSVAWSLSSN